MTNLHNVEKLQGKKHYTGYATFQGKPVIFHIRPVKGMVSHKWAGQCADAKIGATWVPSVRGQTLADVSAALATLA